MRILLVEDDQLLGDGIAVGLKQDNYIVEWVSDGIYAQNLIMEESFSAVILDLGLPRKDGLSILKYIRRNKISTPILILTAKNTSDDLVKAMNSGADDFLSKPFEFSVLTARLNALIRRSQGQASSDLVVGDIKLDTLAHTVTKNGLPVKVSRREYVVLKVIMSNAGKVVTRAKLVDSLYSLDDEIDSNTIEVHVHNLRKKLGGDLISTVRGVGYLLKKTELKPEVNLEGESIS